MSEQVNNDTMVAEIGEAIKSMNAENAPAPQVSPGEETQPVATAEPAPKEITPTAEEFVADDALLKRGILAGLDAEDVRAFKSAEQADRILAALEAKKDSPKEEAEGKTDGEGAGVPTDAFDDMVKEMEDAKDEDGNPDYDPKFVAMFKAMSSLLKNQSNELAALKKAGASAEAQTSFDKAFNGLDEGVRSHVNAATKSKLKAKFDFLKTAHESAKDKATDSEVFEEASKIVLGDLLSSAGAESRTAMAQKRQSLVIARPGGESGLKGSDRPVTEEDVADMLFRQLTK